MYSRPKTFSKTYRMFKDIDAVEYRKIMRFYEKHEQYFDASDFFEYYDMMAVYTNALFQIGAYQKHILMATNLIETTIANNITIHNGEDIFHKTLFDKAASHFNLHELPKAEHILLELLKINPNDKQSALFLAKCKLKNRPTYLKKTRAICILLILLTSLIIVIELLVIMPFFPNLHSFVEYSRITTFIAAILLLGGVEAYNYYQIKQNIKKILENNIKQRNK